MLYMAYGMNTNKDAMGQRCPDAKPLGGFYLPKYRLVFRGVADIVPDDTCVCPVVLWDITPKCLEALDRLEGYPTLYGRKSLNGGWITYQMRDTTRESPPSAFYYDMIEQGYKDFGLDDWHLRAAKADTERAA
tara:strand:+ start:992 stop:1390 length:399 start_codon:yes stop_codon:yes gene_type:complete